MKSISCCPMKHLFPFFTHSAILQWQVWHSSLLLLMALCRQLYCQNCTVQLTGLTWSQICQQILVERVGLVWLVQIVRLVPTGLVGLTGQAGLASLSGLAGLVGLADLLALMVLLVWLDWLVWLVRLVQLVMLVQLVKANLVLKTNSLCFDVKCAEEMMMNPSLILNYSSRVIKFRSAPGNFLAQVCAESNSNNFRRKKN